MDQLRIVKSKTTKKLVSKLLTTNNFKDVASPLKIGPLAKRVDIEPVGKKVI